MKFDNVKRQRVKERCHDVGRESVRSYPQVGEEEAQPERINKNSRFGT